MRSEDGTAEMRCRVCGNPTVPFWDSMGTAPVGWRCQNPECPMYMKNQLEVWIVIRR